MNFAGLEAFIFTFLIMGILVDVAFEKQSLKHNRINEIRKSINDAIGPNIRGIIKIIFALALAFVQIKLNYQHAMFFGTIGGITMGLMAYFFEPKNKGKRSIIITNNLKTLGIQFILIAINWCLLWMESEFNVLLFSIFSVPIYFFAGFAFLRPTGKCNWLSVIVLFVILLVDAIVAAITWDISPGIINPACAWVYVGYYFESSIITQGSACILLSIVPPLFLYFGILVRKKLWKPKEIEVATGV